MLTDNEVLVDRLEVSPTIMCAQRKAQKKIVTEDDVVKSNIDSFGNDIGKVTNRVTAMFEMQSKFDRQSPEFEMLDYRIKCGQLIQQNVIDKSKGIVAKPMPRFWHDRHALSEIDNDDTYNTYREIVADRKPYFMRYIYPDLMKQYNTYINNTNKNALREFSLSVEELKSKRYDELTERQKEFLRYYDMLMPVGVGSCEMNKICRWFENEFSGYVSKNADKNSFDYTIMKKGVEYSPTQVSALKKLCDEYNSKLKSYVVFTKSERPESDDVDAMIAGLKEEFRRECDSVCQNRYVLCDILLDICYKRTSTKKFVWDMCAETIIENLLAKNGNKYMYPAADDNGDITYGGCRFKINEFKVVDETYEYSVE